MSEKRFGAAAARRPLEREPARSQEGGPGPLTAIAFGT